MVAVMFANFAVPVAYGRKPEEKPAEKAGEKPAAEKARTRRKISQLGICCLANDCPLSRYDASRTSN